MKTVFLIPEELYSRFRTRNLTRKAVLGLKSAGV